MKIKKVAVGNYVEAYIEDRFSNGLNVISSDDNNKGKTILIQSMMYAFGNEPAFPTTFDYKNYYHYVEFEISDKTYQICRYNNGFVLKNSSVLMIFDSVSELKRYWKKHILPLPSIIKNEITAHAVAASINVPGVQTILEIGGQDSKIIILRDGIVTDFAMNTVCAAGTGSFLDQQANRLNVPIEIFGETALKSTNPARIAGRCGVFAESDLIHKQQLGYPVEDLLYGLCQALVRNYLSNLALGKELLPTITFQGGVATNSGMVKAFEEALGQKIIVPENHQTMGAIGAALLAMENHQYTDAETKFKGWQVGDMHFHSITCDCNGCSNNCEVITILEGEGEVPHYTNIKDIKGNIIARWGGTCGRWDIS